MEEQTTTTEVAEVNEAATSGEKTEKTSEKTKVSATPKTKKSKIRQQVLTGNVYIQSTYNNTIVTFTDQHGNALAQSSAGNVGFSGPKKSTPYAAGIIVKKAVEKVKPLGLKEVYVFVKGVGSGREGAIRALNANGVNVISIKDVTPIPHNGCRPRKPRRI